MEKIGFIGGYDKTDLIIYTAKILTELGNKVLILDTTITQKTRYIVPAINPTITYITQFQNMDVAVGFTGLEKLKEYLGMEEEELNYDYILIDIDNTESIIQTGLTMANKIYFVTAFDLYSLKKGMEIVSELKQPLKLTKVYFSRTYYSEDDEYLEFLSLGKKLVWEETILYFPSENGDKEAIAENQRMEKIKFKNLSNDYKEGMLSLVGNILGEKPKELRNIFKNIE